MSCQCTPTQGYPHIVKNAPLEVKELRYKIGRYGIYLGMVYWRIGNAKDCEGNEHWLGRHIRWIKAFRVQKLVKSGGVSFWDIKYFV